MAEIADDEACYLRAALHAAGAARSFLAWMEYAGERLAPERSSVLAEETERTYGPPFRAARAALAAAPAPAALAGFAQGFGDGFAHAERACALFASFAGAPPMERIPRILTAMHEVAQAQESFYFFRRALPPFEGYWWLPGQEGEDLAPRRGDDGSPPTGVVHVSAGGHHGGFALYVPESYTDERAWPVIVALHGGSGNGRDFLWTWLREAKSLGYLLVAPTAVADTWSEVDDQGLLEILGWLGRQYRVDGGRAPPSPCSTGWRIPKSIAPWRRCAVFSIPPTRPSATSGGPATCPSISSTARSIFCFPSSWRGSPATSSPRPGPLSRTASCPSSRTPIRARRTSAS